MSNTKMNLRNEINISENIATKLIGLNLYKKNIIFSRTCKGDLQVN